MTSLLLLIRGRSPSYGIFSPSGCNCFRCGNDDLTRSLVINASCEMSVESIDTLSNRGSPAVEERSHHFTLVSIALFVVIAARIVRSGSSESWRPSWRSSRWPRSWPQYSVRAARSNRRAGHFVSFRYRQFAVAVHLRHRDPARGVFDCANLVFKGNASRSLTAKNIH